jgi:hypothetical protein
MRRLVEPAASKLVTHPLGDFASEPQLRRLVEMPAQAAIVRRRLIRNRLHDRQQLPSQFGKKRANRSRGHSFIRVIDEGIGRVIIGCKKFSVFAAEFERSFQERQHRGEVVCRPRPGPGIERGGAVRIGARNEIGRYSAGLFKIAPGNAHEESIGAVGRERFRPWGKRVDEPAQSRIGRAFVREPAQQGALAAAGSGAGSRHIGCLVPAEDGGPRIEVGNFEQAVPQFRDPGFDRRLTSLAERSVRLGGRQ